MKKIRHILVPVDFTEFSNRAVDAAALIAGRFKATVTLVHVIEEFTYDLTDTALIIDPYAALETVARRLLQGLHDKLRRRGLTVRTAIVRGHPAVVILEQAGERRSDLIVMGTHGRTGLERVVMGSVAARVVRLAPCPVLTVGGGGRKHRKPLPLI
jgi:nucleotide-binding universal stress UspA family protein